MYFCFNGDKKLSEDVGFNSNIKDDVDGDGLLQVSNLACSFFYLGFRVCKSNHQERLYP